MSVPEPPADLAARTPLLTTLSTRRRLHRFHGGGHGPIYYNPGRGGRLNAPDGSYGVLYVAKAAKGAFAESFLREPSETLLAPDFIAARAYAQFRVEEPLRVIKLHGDGLRRLGATAEVTHAGPPYDAAQRWSKALHAHACQADGIAYNARHDDDQVCYAIFDRARAKLGLADRRRDLDVDWFYELMDAYGVGLAPSAA